MGLMGPVIDFGMGFVMGLMGIVVGLGRKLAASELVSLFGVISLAVPFCFAAMARSWAATRAVQFCVATEGG